MYAMLGTRPDLCLSISLLSRFQNCASNLLHNLLKRLLRYVKGTLKLKLIYKRNHVGRIIGYADADWGGDTTDRKSTSGFCFFVNGCIVSWGSKKQSTVALSSTEAEYISLSLCVSEACFLVNMLRELNYFCEKRKAVIFEDNQSTIRCCNSLEQIKRIKHLDIKFHFIKEKIRDGTVEIRYINTREQVADILTKPLNKATFERLRQKMFH
jgi:hypothetical protein